MDHVWSTYLDIIHVDRANLIMWYLSIWWFNLETGHTIATVRTLRSFLWYVMNDITHVMQSWFLGYMDSHSSHSPWLNHVCKIECLHTLFFYVVVQFLHFGTSNFMFSLPKETALKHFTWWAKTKEPCGLNTIELKPMMRKSLNLVNMGQIWDQNSEEK